MNTLALLHFLTLLVLLSVAVVTDLKDRRIPNWITVPGLLAGLIAGALMEGGVPVAALSGAVIAFLVSLPVFVLGGFGAGDVKLFTAVGAFVSAGGLVSVVVYGGLAGGILALANAARRGALLGLLLNTKNLLVYGVTGGRAGVRIDLESSPAHAVPYGVAIAVGTVLSWFFPLSLGGGS